VPINTGLAHLSNGFLICAVVVYAVAMVAYACDFAFGKKKAPAVLRARVPELVSAQAGGSAPVAADAVAAGPGNAVAGGDGPGENTVVAADQRLGRRPVGFWVTTAVVLTGVGLAFHLAGVTTRGLAVHRLPWGDMYEFVTSLTCVAMAFFLAAMIRYRAYYMGLFLTAAVVLVLGLAETVIYTPAGELPPALQSYWLAIHVTAMRCSGWPRPSSTPRPGSCPPHCSPTGSPSTSPR
jgi:hypothetical protein